MEVKTTNVVTDKVTGDVHCTLTAVIDRACLLSHVAAMTGDDGLGDPTTSKGLQQVIYKDGSFHIMSYRAACESSMLDSDFVVMIDVSAVRSAIRQALN